MDEQKLETSNGLDKVDALKPEDPRFHPIYGVHVYWAKKFPNIIRTCIKTFTKEKDIVLDPFAGSGVTPIEALILGRKAIAFDICPLSCYIMEKILEPIPPEQLAELKRTFEIVKKKLWGTAKKWMYVKELYRTRCPLCGSRQAITLEARYDSINEAENPIKREWKLKAVKLKCENCKKRVWKILRGCDVKEVYENGKKKSKKVPIIILSDLNEDESWLHRLKMEHPKGPVPYMPLLPNTRINVYPGMSVADLYTKRNLLALAAIKQEITNIQNEIQKELLKFAFSCNLHMARMTDYKRASPQNYYIPKKDMTEINVWTTFEKRIPEIIKCKEYVWIHIWSKIGKNYGLHDWNAQSFQELKTDKWVMIKKADATKLNEIISEPHSIHYVHTDPPYADQVPYLEIAVPWIAWLDLEEKSEWEKQLRDEIILSDSPNRPDKFRDSKEGLDDYRLRFLLSFEKIRDVLKEGGWLSVWYCCSNEDYWRPLTDNLNKLGFERVKSHIISRAVTTFKQAITTAHDPLSKVREEEILSHYRYTGKPIPVKAIPVDQAIVFFMQVAQEEAKRRGEVSTGELMVAFFTKCLDEFDNPPPDYDYFALLKKDDRFEVVKYRLKVGKKEIEQECWRLKETGQKSLGEWIKNG
jgi:DNA modification methylase